MTLSRNRVIAPLWLLVAAAALLILTLVARGQLAAPPQHQVLLRVPVVNQMGTEPSDGGAPRPSQQPSAQQQESNPPPSQVLLQAKGAQRQPPTSQSCGPTALEVCPDQ